MNKYRLRRQVIQTVLFLLTIVTTTLAGAEWIYGHSALVGPDSLEWEQILDGWQYSVPLLLFLTVHEFGHYFMAKHHEVGVSMPYYIPFYLGFLGMPGSLGTAGAFIRIREKVNTRTKYFDIGIAGPLAGFVVALGILFYGFTNLPEPDYIYKVHPEYEEYGANWADHFYGPENDSTMVFVVGKNLLFQAFETYVVQDKSLIPHEYELIHYPWLMAGFFALFVTALNLLPIGQLDGGHVLYSLIGAKAHRVVSAGLFIALLFYAGLGLFNARMEMSQILLNGGFYVFFLYYISRGLGWQRINRVLLAVALFAAQFFVSTLIPGVTGYAGWLLFGFLLGRVLGVYHPPALHDRPLNVLCFSPEPLKIVSLAAQP